MNNIKHNNNNNNNINNKYEQQGINIDMTTMTLVAEKLCQYKYFIVFYIWQRVCGTAC